MNRSSLRAFGIACFLIGVSFLIINQFEMGETKTINTNKYEQTIETLEQQLEEANNQITLLEQAKQPKKTVNESTEKTEPESEDDPYIIETSKEVVHETLHIYSGLTGYEIGKKLEDLGIVKNGLEMELYLAKPEYAKSIQIGQFELNSSMSIERIANIVTGKE